MNDVRLGLRANAVQFGLLVGLNVLVGALAGTERSVLAPVGRQDFGVASKTAVLSFIVAFGAAKALANLAAGRIAQHGRRRVLAAGWALALPAPLLIGLAPSWGYVVAANLFLGASQGLAWSMTVLMKIDLVGPRRRGLALGLNESAGYVGVAVAAAVTGWAAGSLGPRTVVWAGAAVLAPAGLALTLALVRETLPHVRFEEAAGAEVAARASLRLLSQAGFVNNLNDAAMWGLVPLYLAAHGGSHADIGLVAGLYPLVWGVGQLGAGALSDHVGRKPLVLWGMLVQAAAFAILVAGEGTLGSAVAAAVVVGAGTALVYPTLLAAVSDAVAPRDRARANGVYRFWRDTGLVAGALLGGAGADGIGSGPTLAIVGAVTALSGLVFVVPGAYEQAGRFWKPTTNERRTMP
ncbi:MAG TPA: MFS transporter [Gaiellaceae bacterium]|jgi:MFS family permease|nr:MFS transporter [Gaiellaceae bacterium]